LFNIEMLRFSDGNGGTVDYRVDQLFNIPATGAPVISDTTPTEGQLLTVDTSGIADENGLGAGEFAFQWQVSTDNGVSWTDIAGATAAAFAPTDGVGGQVGSNLRVSVTFTDGGCNTETLFSAPTGIVGDNWTGTTGEDVFLGTQGDDIVSG